MMRDPSFRSGAAPGFTLVEMIVVVFLLAIAMLGILAVFDASARINKSEQDVADAQGAVRYGIYQMTRAIRMAGSGGLYVTQAVLNARDPNMPGIAVGSPNGYDNVTGATVTDLSPTAVPVRPGTDMIEIRGVINSPLLGFDGGSGCVDATCTSSTAVNVKALTGNPAIGEHVNNDATKRPQFAAIDAYTASLGGVGAQPMFVIVSGSDDLHGGCSVAFGPQRYPQPTYNVGSIISATALGAATPTFGPVNFTDAVGRALGRENPSAPGPVPPPRPITTALRHAGVLDDLIYFINNTDPQHPALSQGTRRGNNFDVVTLADDVEDMQIAYGVDINGDGAVGRLAATTGTDPDLSVSNQAGKDEWLANVPSDSVPAVVATGFPGRTGVYLATDFQSQQPPPATFVDTGFPPSAHCPRLHGVMIALVAKSRDSDPTFRSPTALGFKSMNSLAVPSVGRYRRRVQMLKINLRNYAFGGST